MASRYLSFLHRSIQGRLALLVGAVLLPAAVLVAWLIFKGYENERRQLEHHLIAAVRATSLLVDSEINERESLLFGLATSGRLQRGDLGLFRAQAQAVVRRSDEWILLLDAAGNQRMNTLGPEDVDLAGFAYDPEFRQTVEAGRTYISNLVPGTGEDPPLLFVGIPIFQEQKLLYTLVLVTRPAVFRDALVRGGVSPAWTVSIVDRQGVLAARTRNPVDYVGAKAGDLIADAITKSQEGVLESVTLDGISSITAHSRSLKSGWTLIVAAPAQELFASAQRLLGVALAVSLLLGAGGAMLAVWVGRGVVSAVQALVQETEAMGRGEAVAGESTGIAETDTVLRALAETSARLAGREAELKQLNESLTRAGRAKDEFLAALSHELRTPLNPVLLTAS
ncbi:MAG TPA: cache domain-containing protein, partial [Opitutus sp.]|nr:cache domain-containing protein [Opitutus sp.]